MNSLNILPVFVDATGVAYYNKSKVKRELLELEGITAHFRSSACRHATPEEMPYLKTLGMQTAKHRGRMVLVRADAVQKVLKRVAPSSNDIKRSLCPSAYIPINSQAGILRATHHQGDYDIFKYVGVQCCAMAIANIIRGSVLLPERWNTRILDENMIEGDELYGQVYNSSSRDRLLTISNFDSVKKCVEMFGSRFSLEYDKDTDFMGSLEDEINDGVCGLNFNDALQLLFQGHNAGIVITGYKTYGVMKYSNQYYFTDSHSCGADGAPATADDGKACIVQCSTFEELLRVCRRATGRQNVPFDVYYIKVKRLRSRK